MSLNTSLLTVLQTLQSHVLDLKDEGVRTVECGSAARFRSPAAPPADAPAAPATSAAAAAVPRVLPDKASLPAFVMCTARRNPVCGDATPTEDTALRLFLEPRDLREKASADLLQAMLAAIGYLVEGESVPVRSPEELKGGPKRILCFGDAAQRQVSPMKMALSLVRGKWQNTPYGRMMALESPANLHNNPTGKKAAWGDLKRVLQDLNLPLPPRGE